MVGTNNCTACTYSWQPNNLVENTKEAFPVLKNPIPQCHSSLIANTVDENGCIFNNNVDVFNIGDIQLSFTTDMDQRTSKSAYCYYKIVGKVQFNCSIPQDKFSLKLYNSLGDFSQSEIIASTDNKTYEYVFYVPTNKLYPNTTLKVVFNDISYQVVGNCEIVQNISMPNRDKYWQSLPTINGTIPGHSIFIPNRFSPNGDGIDDEFRAFSSTGQGYNAFWYKIGIFNRWGGKVFEKEEYAPIPNLNTITLFGNDQWIRWDGKFQGTKVPLETHVWYINMENCVEARQEYNLSSWHEGWKGDILPTR